MSLTLMRSPTRKGWYIAMVTPPMMLEAAFCAAKPMMIARTPAPAKRLRVSWLSLGTREIAEIMPNNQMSATTMRAVMVYCVLLKWIRLLVLSKTPRRMLLTTSATTYVMRSTRKGPNTCSYWPRKSRAVVKSSSAMQTILITAMSYNRLWVRKGKLLGCRKSVILFPDSLDFPGLRPGFKVDRFPGRPLHGLRFFQDLLARRPFPRASIA